MSTSSASPTSGPLSGIRVLELGRLIAAPTCGQILGDLGADVVKVERSDSGDEYRNYGPHFIKDAAGENTREASSFMSVNRNKRSISLDFSDPESLRTARQLAERCDVLIENFKVGALQKYGLDREAVSRANPQVIYLSVTGFGQDGPFATRVATDGVCQAMSGFQSLNGEPEGEAQRTGVSIVDMVTGLYGAISVLAALRAREVLQSGGQSIDAALLDAAVALVGHKATDYRLSGVEPRRNGNAHVGAAPSQDYRCRDGWIFVQAAWDHHFERLCHCLGKPELAQDERFRFWSARVQNSAVLNSVLEPLFADQTVAELSARLDAAEILNAPINSVPEALENAQVKHRALEVPMRHPLGAEVRLTASPVRLSKTPVSYRRPPPMLGQHTAEVLRDWLPR
jgi:crotonobetainyl-CoA:carnitine CoA-transferase CaiB-like acyl-CoA transferase